MDERFRKPWTEEEMARLRNLAGSYTTAQIAQELGRGVPATIAKARELQISLRKKRKLGLKNQSNCPEPGPAGLDVRLWPPVQSSAAVEPGSLLFKAVYERAAR